MDGHIKTAHDGRDVTGVSTQQQWREIGDDGQLHALWRLGAIGQPA